MRVAQILTGAAMIAAALGAWVGPARAAEYVVDGANPAASDTGPGSTDHPFQTIDHAAGVASPGDTVMVRAGLYRESVHLRKSGAAGAPITFQADPPGSVTISGADPVTAWKRVAGDSPIYSAPWPYLFAIDYHNGQPIEHHPEDAPLWGRAEQIIADGKQLLPALSLADLRAGWKRQSLRPADDRAASLPGPLPRLGPAFTGMFFADTPDKRLYVWLMDGSDPAAHQMQGSSRAQTFGVNPWESKSGVSYVNVRGFHFRYGASFPQRAVVWLYGSHNLLEDCTIDDMAGSGVSVNGVMRRCTVRGCGQTGGGAQGDGFLNEDCLWEGNCWKPIDRGWDAGGFKTALSKNGLFRRCVFRRNGGPGLWFDIDVHDVTVTDCTFEENEGSGLFVEISRGITIVHNRALRNAIGAVGFSGKDDWSAGGIVLAESENCVVAFNTCVGNKDGITFREQGPRPLDTEDGTLPFHDRNDVIVDNVSALNQGYQLGLWYDNGFFGWHPAEKSKYKTVAAYEAYLKAHPDTVYDPTKQGLTIDHNLYFAGPDQHLILYGVPWRPRYHGFDQREAFTAATGFDAHSEVADPRFKDPAKGDLSVHPGSPVNLMGVGDAASPAPDSPRTP